MQQAGGGEARRAAVEVSAADAADGHPEVGDAAPCQAWPAVTADGFEAAAGACSAEPGCCCQGGIAEAWSEAAADGSAAAEGACLAEPGCCCQGGIAGAWSAAAADGSEVAADGSVAVAEGAPAVLFAAVKV